MGTREVIEKIKSRIESGRVINYKYGIDIDDKYTNFDDLNLAIQALEKQVPKKPIESGMVWLNKKCPNCYMAISRAEEGIFNYCKFCGQAFDWD